MTSSASGQDEPNLALWLATRAGKRELSCPLAVRALSRKYNLSCFGVLSHINPLLTKLVRSRWLDIGLVLFLLVHGARLRLGPWTRKKRTWPISSHLDRTSLVNNPYVWLQTGLKIPREWNSDHFASILTFPCHAYIFVSIILQWQLKSGFHNIQTGELCVGKAIVSQLSYESIKWNQSYVLFWEFISS